MWIFSNLCHRMVYISRDKNSRLCYFSPLRFLRVFRFSRISLFRIAYVKVVICKCTATAHRHGQTYALASRHSIRIGGLFYYYFIVSTEQTSFFFYFSSFVVVHCCFFLFREVGRDKGTVNNRNLSNPKGRVELVFEQSALSETYLIHVLIVCTVQKYRCGDFEGTTKSFCIAESHRGEEKKLFSFKIGIHSDWMGRTKDTKRGRRRMKKWNEIRWMCECVPRIPRYFPLSWLIFMEKPIEWERTKVQKRNPLCVCVCTVYRNLIQ